MLHRNQLLMLDGNELQFYGGRAGGPEDAKSEWLGTPLQSLMKEFLSWLHGRYADGEIYVQPAFFLHRLQNPSGLRKKHKAVPKKARKALAAKLENHDAILELLDRKLDEEWPEHDHAGDRWQVKKPPVSSPSEDKGEPSTGSAKDELEEDVEEEPAEDLELLREVLIGRLSRRLSTRRSSRRRPLTAPRTCAATEASKKANPIATRYSRRLRNEVPSQGEVKPAEVATKPAEAERPAKRRRLR